MTGVVVPEDAIGEVAVTEVTPDEVTYPCAFTNAVVAIWVVFVAVAAVGAVGVPVNSGLAKFAFKLKAVCVAVETGLLASLVLSTLDNPTSVFVTVSQLGAAACVPLPTESKNFLVALVLPARGAPAPPVPP